MKLKKTTVLISTALLFLLSCTSIGEKENRVISSSNIGTAKVDGNTYTSKGQNSRIRFIIIHYTVSNKARSIDLLTNTEVSSHYLITDDKEDPIFYLVDENKRAWHAGSSNWKNFTNLNDNSIGIEIVNKGYLMENGEMKFFEFTPDQIQKSVLLLKDLIKRYNIEPQNILGHSDIAPQRKEDPGPLFPWEVLYKTYGIGIWYDEETKEKYTGSLKIVTPKDVQNELRKFGYPIETTNIYDEQTRNVIRVFQFHFRASKYDGLIDDETFSILKALNEKYNK